MEVEDSATAISYALYKRTISYSGIEKDDWGCERC